MSKILNCFEKFIRISPLDATSITAIMLPVRLILADEINISLNLRKPGVSQRKSLPHSANEIGDRYLSHLKQHQINTSSKTGLGEIDGASNLENGFGCRQSEVFYDRKSIRVSARFGQTC